MKRYVVSDIHLGSEACETKLFTKFLNQLHYDDELIINGDLVDHWKGKKWKHKHRELFERISCRQNTILIAGNHEGGRDKAYNKSNLNWHESFSFDHNGKHFYICHGHQWDDFIGKYPVIEYISEQIYIGLQRMDHEHRIARAAKHAVKKFIKCIGKVAQGALSVNADHVLCGHTHYPMHLRVGSKEYLNSGSWVEKPGTWIEIGEKVQLRTWEAVL